MWFMPKKKDNLIGAYRRPPPTPDAPTAVNLNVSGGLTLQLVQPPPPDPSLRAVFTANLGGITVRGSAPMAYTLPDDKQIVVRVSYQDAQGHDVELPQGNVAWTTSDDMIANVGVLSTDDQQAEIIPGKNNGNAQITCTGTNADGTSVVATLDVTVVPGDAVSGSIQPQGDPQPFPGPSQASGGQGGRSGQRQHR
jgi:hypothetical protein